MTRKFKSQRAMIFFPSPPDLWITSSNSSDTRVALIKISFRLETFNRIQSPPNSVEARRRRRRRRKKKKAYSFSNFQRDLFIWNFICIEARTSESKEGKTFSSTIFAFWWEQRRGGHKGGEKARCNYTISASRRDLDKV